MGAALDGGPSRPRRRRRGGGGDESNSTADGSNSSTGVRAQPLPPAMLANVAGDGAPHERRRRRSLAAAELSPANGACAGLRSPPSTPASARRHGRPPRRTPTQLRASRRPLMRPLGPPRRHPLAATTAFSPDSDKTPTKGGCAGGRPGGGRRRRGEKGACARKEMASGGALQKCSEERRGYKTR
jgi:hypothetical protein